MDAEKLNKWLGLIANLGVIVGIAFLVLEIRQSNRIAIASNEIAVRQGWAGINEAIVSNMQLAELLAKARSPDAEFTQPQVEVIDAYVARQFNDWIAIEKAYENEMVSAATLNTAKEDIKWAIDTYPAFRSFYRLHIDTYPSESETAIYKAAAQHLERTE